MPILRLGERRFAAAPQPGEAMCCPGCGNDEVASADVVLVTSPGRWQVPKTGTGRLWFDARDAADVCWNTIDEQDDDPCHCRVCEWRGEPHELVTAQRFYEITLPDEPSYDPFAGPSR